MIFEQSVPHDLKISEFVSGSHFADCFVSPNPKPSLSAMEIFLKTVNSPPAWVNALMSLRNRLVQLVGLKNLGGLHGASQRKSAADYKIGDRAGIFTVLYLSDNEVVMGDKDKHLEVRVSVSKRTDASGQSQIVVCTVVHEHNALGKFYMFLVGPIHKGIVPAVLRTGLRELVSA
jgi:hypothetical protein